MTSDPKQPDGGSDEPLDRKLREVLDETETTEPRATPAPAHVVIEGYDIIRELHRGGQGVVYEAVQKSTRRKVAIKILLEGRFASSSARRRFQREITLAAGLKHPNIITIFDSGETPDGHQFCVMDYVRGRSIRSHVRQNKLALEETLELFCSVCEAAHFAHQKGVIHRDLKPSNILVDADGMPKVLDFGLAKQLAGGTESLVSMTGQVMGTLEYMSPEQTRGNPDEIDARSDVYSLGVVLYELLTGQHPYPVKGHMTDVLKHITETEPVPPSKVWTADSGVSRRKSGRFRVGQCPIDDELRTILLKSLSKGRERRYQSAEALRQDIISYLAGEPIEAKRDSSLYVLKKSLRRHRTPIALTVAAIAIVLVTLFVGLRLGGRQGPALVPTGPITSLAVLPFANDSGDTDADFLCDGIAESVINSLSAIPEMRVISRNTAFRYRGRENELDQVARDLKVRSVLTGRVTKRGERVVVSVALEDMENHEQLWGERFDCELADILTLEREISERITDALRLTVSAKEQSGRDKPGTENPDARLAYMQGRFWWNKRTLKGFQKSLEHYDRAIEFDPNYALAYAGKAATYAMMGVYTHPPREVMPLAERAAERAIELNPLLAEAHTSLGWIRATYDWDWEGAAQSYQKAIQLNPRYATAHHWYGWLLYFLGRVDESQREFEAALRLDPQSLIICTNQGWPHMSRGHINLAIEASQRTIEMDASFPHAHFDLGMAYLAKRQYEHAIQEFGTALSLAPDTTNYDGLVGFALGLAGRRTEALAELDTLEQASRKRYVPFTAFGLIHTGLGNRNRAFQYLNRACDAREIMMVRLKIAPFYDPLRHDQRFDELLQRMGFPADPPAPVAAPWKPQPTRLAVLPFENVSSDTDTEYLSNEIPASIIDKLSSLSGFSVISRSGAFRFDPTKEDASSFGRNLGASVVLTGQLNARGNSLTIRAELVDVATNQQLWSKRYARELTDIMAVEADITQNISEALRLQLTQEERTELAKDDTKDADAYRAVLEGRFWFQKFTLAGWRRALGHFQDAVRIDPKYAVAHAELSKVYGALGVWFGDMPPDEAGPKAKQAAATAIALDDTLGEAHGALALNRFFYDWDWSGAEEEFLRSISLAPESGEVHLQYGILLRVTGRLREAEEVIKVAQKLDPTFPMNFAELGETYAYMGRYEEGIEQCKKALVWDPEFPPAFQALGYLFLAKGMYDEAISHLEKNSSLRNRQTDDLGSLGSAYALAGQRTKALAVLNELRGVSSKGRGQVAAAKIHACLGNVDAAFSSLEQAYRQRDPGLIWLNTELQFDPLRGDPRYVDLARRMGFEPDSKPQSMGKPPESKIMLAVLPFENLGSPDDEYFADGISDEIRSRLAAVRKLGVISRSSAFQYKNTDKSNRQIGSELGVDYLIDGTIRWDKRAGVAGRVRITPELIRVSDDVSLWSQPYNRVIEDIFEVQSDIAGQVIKQLNITLFEPERQAIEATPTNNLDAYQAYLRGLDRFASYSTEDGRLAVEMFERAVELDPAFALAFAGLSRAHARLYIFGDDRTDARVAKAKAAVDRALELQPDLTEAQLALANYWYQCRLEYDKALELLAVAAKSSPNHPGILRDSAFIHRRRGQVEDAVVDLQRVFDLSPREADMAVELAWTYAILRRYEEAIRYYDRAIALQPDQRFAYIWKAEAYVLWRGDTASARATLENIPEQKKSDARESFWELELLERNYPAALDRLGFSTGESRGEPKEFISRALAAGLTYLMVEDHAQARAAFDSAREVSQTLLEEQPNDPVLRGRLAVAYAGLGRKEKSLREVKRRDELGPISKDAVVVGPVRAVELAYTYVLLAEYDAALDRIEYLLSIPTDQLSIAKLRLDPRWDPLRDHPRYKDLLRRHGFDPDSKPHATKPAG